MFGRSILTGIVGRVVEDRTGLPGGYDFELEFAVESGAGLQRLLYQTTAPRSSPPSKDSSA
jgi:uncharacterized protein (TIGR03435 family)